MTRWSKTASLSASVTCVLCALLLAGCGEDESADRPVDTPPAILSAFWGANDVPGVVDTPLVCPGLVGPRDGMPVVTSVEIGPDALVGAVFAVVRADGTTVSADCALREPADEENEDRTVLLVGDFASTANPPVAVRIVSSLPLEDGSDAVGAESTTVVGLEAGPSLIVAERVTTAEAEYGAPDDCPADTTVQIVRTIWSGGVDGDQGQELTAAELSQWTVEVDADGTRADVTPIGFGDLNDGDNNVDLCLADSRPALAVRVVEHAVTDPTNDWNVAQDVAVTAD